MLTHSKVDNRSKHLLHLIRIKRPRRPRTSNKQQVRIGPQVNISTIEPVESSDHDYKALAHPTLEQFASDIVPLVQPVVNLPHLLQLSLRILHRDGTRELFHSLRHIIRKQQNRLRRLTESLEQFVKILEQRWKVTSRSQRLHI